MFTRDKFSVATKEKSTRIVTRSTLESLSNYGFFGSKKTKQYNYGRNTDGSEFSFYHGIHFVSASDDAQIPVNTFLNPQITVLHIEQLKMITFSKSLILNLEIFLFIYFIFLP